MNWLVIGFSSKFGHYFATKLLNRYLNQPYGFFLNRNSADLGKNILSESHRCVSGVISPVIEIISKFVVILFVITLLILIDPYIATAAISILGLVYLIIYFSVRRILHEVGEKSAEAILRRYKVANEAISSIKELKLHGKEQVFIDRFDKVSQLHAKYDILAGVIAMLPRHFLDSLIFSGVVLTTIFLVL